MSMLKKLKMQINFFKWPPIFFLLQILNKFLFFLFKGQVAFVTLHIFYLAEYEVKWLLRFERLQTPCLADKIPNTIHHIL